MVAALGSLGGSELIIILVVVLVLFGGSQLPKLARSVGEAQKEFKKGMKEDEEDAQSSPPANGKSKDSSTAEKADNT